MATFKEKLEHFTKSDKEKDAFIQSLIEEIENLTAAKEQIQHELDSSKYLCRKQFDDLKLLGDQNLGLQRSLDRNPFALVLIDGDISPFADSYVERGFEGGHDAARNIRTAVSEYLAVQNKDFKLDTEIIIHVFANISGLFGTYQESGILPDATTFRQFLQGFNREHPLCNFIDAVTDKEAADSKIEAELKLFSNNMHCRHIMFAGSGDNSYTGFLRQYCPTDQEPSKVVLIEALPFARQLGELAVKFKRTELGDLFRKSKLEIAKARRDSFREASVSQAENPPPTTYASRLKPTNGAQDKLPLETPKETVAKVSQVPTGKKIYQNSQGQRVDHPARLWADYEVVKKVKPRKLCNRFFISQDCPFEADMCYNNHKGTLSAEEMAALRFIARSNPCAEDIWCEDADCISSHKCMHGRNCKRWGDRDEPCRFSDDMHTVDIKIARSVEV